MRHQCKRHRLQKPADQRKALMRSLASELFVHGEIQTTMARAKALKPYAENIITFAKKGDLAARRQAVKYIFDKETEKYIDTETGELFDVSPEGKKLPKQTVLRQLFSVIGKKYATRNGGYTRIYRMPPRRGDATEMAIIQLVQ
ncbi:50S ribosomal protein L17 [Candidatus Gastranaerophilus sp. (ex Termes propinquus)]|nr:50S ribosomal protein L17 [Candidatus Gastranaerophilus sp. (ex Termes propinquus)]